MLAMTSIAVTASNCASAPEAAPLVASFMPYLPGLGRDSSLRATRAPTVLFCYSEHPTASIRFDESPLSEYRTVSISISIAAAF